MADLTYRFDLYFFFFFKTFIYYAVWLNSNHVVGEERERGRERGREGGRKRKTIALLEGGVSR